MPAPHCMQAPQYEHGGGSSAASKAAGGGASTSSSGLDGIFADLGSRFNAAPSSAIPSTTTTTSRLGLGAPSAAAAAPATSSSVHAGGGTKLVFGKKDEPPLPTAKETDSLLGMWGKS